MILSALGAEIFGIADSCDHAILIQHDLIKSLKMKLKIKILTDIETLFYVVIKNASTTVRRLMIDIKVAIKAYNEVIFNASISSRRE